MSYFADYSAIKCDWAFWKSFVVVVIAVAVAVVAVVVGVAAVAVVVGVVVAAVLRDGRC